MIIDPKCFNCIFLTSNENGFFYCKAFPNTENRSDEEIQSRTNNGIILDPKGIPDDILFGQNDHITLYKGQVGNFMYAPKGK